MLSHSVHGAGEARFTASGGKPSGTQPVGRPLAGSAFTPAGIGAPSPEMAQPMLPWDDPHRMVSHQAGFSTVRVKECEVGHGERNGRSSRAKR